MALAWSAASTKWVPDGAAAGGFWPSIASNATPPTSSAASDCVFNLKPAESSRTSTPLACHQRVSLPTYWSYGALTNTVTVTPEPDGSSEKLTTCPAGMPIKQRRAGVDRAEAFAMQHELGAFLVADNLRHLFQSDEIAGLLLGLAGVDADVGARQQRAQSRHAGGADARPHHPEARVGAGEALGFLGQVYRHQHLRQVRVDLHRAHLADVDVLVFDLGLARLQAVAGVEADRHRRPLVEHR